MSSHHKIETMVSANTIKEKKISKKRTVTMGAAKRRSIIRKPRSSWTFFVTSRRKTGMTEEFKDVSYSNTCKILGPEWRGLSDVQKSPFIDMYQQDKNRYSNDLKNLPAEDLEFVNSFQKSQKKKNRLKPKAVMSKYMCFMRLARPSVVKEFPGLSFAQVASVIGTRWKAISEEDLVECTKLSEEDRLRHRLEIEQLGKNPDFKLT